MWLTKDSRCRMSTPLNHPNTLPHHPASTVNFSLEHLMEGEQLVGNVNCLHWKQEQRPLDPGHKDTPCRQEHHTPKLRSQNQCLKTLETHVARRRARGGRGGGRRGEVEKEEDKEEEEKEAQEEEEEKWKRKRKRRKKKKGGGRG